MNVSSVGDLITTERIIINHRRVIPSSIHYILALTSPFTTDFSSIGRTLVEVIFYAVFSWIAQFFELWNLSRACKEARGFLLPLLL